MPNGANKNLVRIQLACAAYRERYGEWPSECRLHPIGLQDVAHVLDAENFKRLVAHLRLRTKDRMDVSVGGARGVIEYSKLDAGSIDEQVVKLAREWLGVNVRADLEHPG
jgi:hypothetical protein